jgi:hypothetical protein
LPDSVSGIGEHLMHMRGDTGVVALAYGVVQEVLNIAAAESGLVGCFVEQGERELGIAVEQRGEGGCCCGADLGLCVGDKVSQRRFDDAKSCWFLSDESPKGERRGAAGGV